MNFRFVLFLFLIPIGIRITNRRTKICEKVISKGNSKLRKSVNQIDLLFVKNHKFFDKHRVTLKKEEAFIQ